MKNDKVMLILITELFLILGLIIITIVENSFILIKMIFLLCIFTIIIVLLFQRYNFLININKNVNKIKLAIAGNFHTRLFTNNDRACDEFLFSINELIEKSEKVEVQAVRSQVKRKNLLSSISHDIRTPLTSVIGYADALKDQVVTSKEEVEEYLDILIQKSNRLKLIVDEIFDIAKLDSDEMTLNEERFDLSEVIRETIIDFLPDINNNNFDLIVDIPDRQCFIEADKLSIVRVLTNLIKNALSHGRDGKSIEISLKDCDTEYEANIIDKGQGIPNSEISNVFERMYKGMKSRTGSNSGSGLGLSIAKALIEKSGGEIWVKSSPWKKTIFGFTFPKV